MYWGTAEEGREKGEDPLPRITPYFKDVLYFPFILIDVMEIFGRKGTGKAEIEKKKKKESNSRPSPPALKYKE